MDDFAKYADGAFANTKVGSLLALLHMCGLHFSVLAE
jgi:hypothetical protein